MKSVICLLSLLLISTSIFANDSILGLICDSYDGPREQKVNLAFGNTNKEIITLRFWDSNSKIRKVNLKKSDVAALLVGDFLKMDGKTFEDKSTETIITFEARGSDFLGRSRLQIDVAGKDFDIKLESCNLDVNPGASF